MVTRYLLGNFYADNLTLYSLPHEETLFPEPLDFSILTKSMLGIINPENAHSSVQ
jgi:hypothetical protein